MIGSETVKSHVAEVLGKLGLRDRIQAVVFAYEHGLVVPGSPSLTPGRWELRGAVGEKCARLTKWPPNCGSDS